MDARWDALSTEERAAVVAAVRAAGARAPEVLARLAGPRGERCAAEARRLLALGDEALGRALADAARALAAERPAGLELVHPSWLEVALADEPEAVRRAALGDEEGGGPAPAVRRWLRRRVLGELVAMPSPADSDSPALAPAARIEDALERLGRDRLALALRAAPAPAVAAVAARLGPEHGRALTLALRAPVTREAVSAAVRELSDLVAGTAPLLLFRAGARHLAPALVAHGGELARQLAQRLPRDRGLVLRDEVARAEERGIAGDVSALERLRELLRA